MSRVANRCGACERASAMIRGAKCAQHESSTSPTIDRRGLAADPPGWPPPGWCGPVLYELAGGNNPKILAERRRERHLAAKRNATPAQHRAVAAAMLAELNTSITNEDATK